MTTKLTQRESSWHGCLIHRGSTGDEFERRAVINGCWCFNDQRKMDTSTRWSIFTMYWPQLMSCALVGKE